MTCMYEAYQIKIKMAQQLWPQLKIKFLLGHNIEIIM